MGLTDDKQKKIDAEKKEKGIKGTQSGEKKDEGGNTFNFVKKPGKKYGMKFKKLDTVGGTGL